MDGKSKRQTPSKMLNNMNFNDDDQSTISMPAYTPRSSYDTEYSNVTETRSRFLQLGPEMIQISSALRDRLTPGDPMIAAWDDLIDTLQKGCDTPTPKADAAPTRVSDTEKHAINRAPDHEPSLRAERNEGPVWRLCEDPFHINGPSESGYEGVKTGVKRSYAESVASDAHFSSSVTEERPRGGADGPEADAIESHVPTSNDKCICNELGIWDGCKYCLNTKNNVEKCACNGWGLCNFCRNAAKCTCGGWGRCRYCVDAKVDADKDPVWGWGQPRSSSAMANIPESYNTTRRTPWGFMARPFPAMGGFGPMPPTHNIRHATSVPAADPPQQSNYSVTYWATIKYGEQTINIPIDSGNVSGTEKQVIEGAQGMQKVWDWVVEKGLTNKVGLQDAFDLAMDMLGDLPPGFFYNNEGDVDFDLPVKSESGSHRSRRGPLSAKKARLSPAPSDNYSLSVASDILSG